MWDGTLHKSGRAVQAQSEACNPQRGAVHVRSLHADTGTQRFHAVTLRGIQRCGAGRWELAKSAAQTSDEREARLRRMRPVITRLHPHTLSVWVPSTFRCALTMGHSTLSGLGERAHAPQKSPNAGVARRTAAVQKGTPELCAARAPRFPLMATHRASTRATNREVSVKRARGEPRAATRTVRCTVPTVESRLEHVVRAHRRQLVALALQAHVGTIEMKDEGQNVKARSKKSRSSKNIDLRLRREKKCGVAPKAHLSYKGREGTTLSRNKSRKGGYVLAQALGVEPDLVADLDEKRGSAGETVVQNLLVSA
ncbi:hypothetical protein B0H19DRAFT_1083677 [Mycena capillaripes]|nr:hypothetical protein B0H19DRAFT_1083677 [Mycena capillaripes]